MSKECLTKREQFYQNEPEGDIIYDGEDYMTTIERTEDLLIIKVLLSKDIDWLSLADQLSCEVRAIAQWASNMKMQKVTNYEAIEPIRTWQELNQHYWSMSQEELDEDKYLYFYDTYNWVMYECQDGYLFRYDLHKDDRRLGVDDEVDAMRFWPWDDLGAMISFLRRWYYRVTGTNDTPDDDKA